jgi:hypothetical protein
MAISRHATLSQAIVDHIDSVWADKPAGMTVVRAYDYDHLIKDLDDDTESIVAVITPRIGTETSSRKTDRDTLPVFVVMLATLADSAIATVDVWDLLMESLRDSLRSRTLAGIDLGSGVTARRVDSVELPTPYDADYIDASNLFLGVAESEYTISIDVAV